MNSDNRTVEDIHAIIQEQKNYYETLYSSKYTGIEQDSTDNFLDANNPYINRLNETEKEKLEGKLTSAECLTVLKDMKNEKSPEIDGFSKDFY